MRKVIFLCFAFVAFACTSDNIEEDLRTSAFKTAILGSWSYDTVKVDGQTYLYQHTEGCSRDSFHIYNEEERPFYFEERTVMNCDNCAECAISQIYLVWKLKGDKLHLFYGEEIVLTYTLITVSEDKLTYQYTTDYNNDGIKDVLEITAIRIIE